MEERQAVECGQIQHNECRDRKERGRGGEHGGADKHRVYQTWLFRENRSVLIQAVGEGCMLRPAG